MNIFINLEDFFILTSDVKYFTVAGFEHESSYIELNSHPTFYTISSTFNRLTTDFFNA